MEAEVPKKNCLVIINVSIIVSLNCLIVHALGIFRRTVIGFKCFNKLAPRKILELKMLVYVSSRAI